MWAVALLFIILGFTIHTFIKRNFRYWKDNKVPSTPTSKIFKNLFNTLFLRKSIGQVYADIYNSYSNFKYIGVYKVTTPAILVRDTTLIQDVLIKEFSSFHDNDIFVDEKVDPLFGKNPFCLKGDRWKVSRNQLLSCFSSKKLKSMFPLIEAVGKNLVKYITDLSRTSGADGIETKELASQFTTDVVASCAFGLEARSFEDPKAEFREMGRRFLTPTTLLALKHLCVLLIPSLADILDVKFFPNYLATYFRQVVHKSLKYREDNNIVRGDFLDTMKEFQNKLGKAEFSDEDIVSHSAGFFADGFETSSYGLMYSLLELAANPMVQTRLRGEIEKVLKENNGKLTYDTLTDIEYLDNVLQEALRKYPPAIFLARTCTKPYTLSSATDEDQVSEVIVPIGMPMIIPVYAIHHDPKYFPDPERFDPDRFSLENRVNIQKCTFLPFGEGPRICLGMRFGMGQVKVALASILTNFEVRLNKKTIMPLEFDPKFFMLRPKDGVWLNFHQRH